MSRYDRANYFLMPLGVDDQGRGWAVRMPDDYTNQLIGAMFMVALESAFDGDDDEAMAVQEALLAMVRSTPGLSPAITIPLSVGEYVTGRNPYDSFRGRPVFSDREMEVGGWPKARTFARYLLGEAGLNSYVVFDTRQGRPVPTPKTWYEWASRQPMIGPPISKFLRITDYGLVEATRRAQAEEDRVMGERWYREREAIDGAVTAYLAERPDDHREADRLSERMAEQVATLLADQERGEEPLPDYEAYETRMRRSAIVAMRGSGEERALLFSVAFARSHDHAAAGARALVESGVPRARIDGWLDDFVDAGIITIDAQFSIQDRLDEEQ